MMNLKGKHRDFNNFWELTPPKYSYCVSTACAMYFCCSGYLSEKKSPNKSS